jgi:TRAP-type C4-dicarboxylate transport system substrate-binding protein
VKKIIAVLCMVLLVFAIIVSGCPAEPTTPTEPTEPTTPTEPTEPTEPMESVEWTFASFIPQMDIFGYPITDWAAELEEATGGRWKLNEFWAGSLVKPPGLADAIEFGTADMAHLYTAPHSERFPLFFGFSLMGIPFDSPPHLGKGVLFAYEWLGENYPEDQVWFFGPTKLMWFNAPAGKTRSLIHSNREVRNLDDMKGLKIIAERYEHQRAWELLGASPIPLSTAEHYMGLDTGVVDAIHHEYNQTFLWKTYEPTKYRTTNTVSLGGGFPFMCNVDSYNNLPADLKAMFDASYDTLETTVYLNEKWQAWHDINAERIEAFHIERGDPPPYRLPDDESAIWNEMVQPVIEEWIEGKEAKGLPARAMWEAMEQFADETREETEAHLAEVLPGYIEEERPRIE